jgi:hypothetical protein
MDQEAVIASHFDRLRGRILGLIESWGLPVAQERGCKQIFKSLTYDMEAEIKQLFVELANENESLSDSLKKLLDP